MSSYDAVELIPIASRLKHPVRLINTFELSWQKFAFALRHVTGND